MPTGFFDDFVCPHCKKLTSFSMDTTVDVDSFMRSLGGAGSVRVSLSAIRYRCQNPKCLRPLLVLARNTEPTVLLYPPAPGSRTLDSAAPLAVAAAYSEASQCQVIGAMRAAGAMYRKALELLCDEQGIPRTGNNAIGKTYSRLVNRVPDLQAKGLATDLVDNLHEVRLVGNDSVHEGIAFSPAELDDIAGMIEEAVEVLWVQPAQRATMKTAREARRSDSAPPAAPTG